METRHRLRLPFRCPVIFDSDEFIGEGTLIDLGVPGCAVESRVTPSPGHYVRLHVFMPDQHEPLRVGLAKVRWAKQQRFGVEFMAFSDGDQVRLGQLLHRHVDRL